MAKSDGLHNFFGLPADFSSHENSRMVIVPVLHEGSLKNIDGVQSYGAVLKASRQIEKFDEELWVEPYKAGIFTAPAVRILPVSAKTKNPFAALPAAITPLVEIGKFPITLGAEPALSLGSVTACTGRYPKLSILQIGARSALKTSSQASAGDSDCVAYQLYKALPSPRLTQVGVRRISLDEISWLENEQPNVEIFWAHKQNAWNLKEIMGTLSDDVYLDICVDALSTSIMPASKLLEPGGLDWYQLLELLKIVCVRKNVVAASIVGLSPVKSMPGPDYLIARLIYKLAGYRFALELGVTKKYL